MLSPVYETAVQGAGDVRRALRPRTSAQQLRGAEGPELAGGDLGREAREESRQHRFQGAAVCISGVICSSKV